MSQVVTIWKGEDFALTFECRDAAGALIDFTGAEVWAHVRKVADGPLVADLQPVFDDENTGVILIQCAGDLTNAWRAGDFQWDVVVRFSTGAFACVLPTSPIRIAQRMTHPQHQI